MLDQFFDFGDCHNRYELTRHSVIHIVQIKLSAIKSIVNKLPCPKCQGEFLKIPVANVANMFNASLYKNYLHETYMGLQLNYGLRNICI